LFAKGNEKAVLKEAIAVSWNRLTKDKKCGLNHSGSIDWP